VGKPLSVLVPPEQAAELPAILARIRRGERIEHLETQRIRKDGSRLDVSLTISPIIAGDGRIAGASKIARDITSRKEEERRRTEFLAMLAHELRNPLAPIRNGVQLMRLAASDPAVVEQATTMMERQVQHLVRLVDDLLDVSRISRGKLQLRKERVELATVVRNALEVCGQMIEEQEHELSVTFPDQPLYVDADKTRLVQTMCNLLNNAVKYSERGTRIDVSVQQSGDEVAISVKDAGIGILPEMLPKIFEMFTQVDCSLEKSQGGLGVGLTIVKRLIEMHGGSVEARSEGYGTGSEFIVRLPLASTNVPDELPGSSEPPPHANPHRILVVDDHLDAASSLAIMLRIMGHEVHTAHDGLEAIEVADAIRPDLILLDIGMPRLDGYETCRRLREHDGGRDASIIALTGWGQDEDKRRSAEAGFDGHLIKPAEPATLGQLLAGLKPAAT
jgi:signal transduction histidine kinase